MMEISQFRFTIKKVEYTRWQDFKSYVTTLGEDVALEELTVSVKDGIGDTGNYSDLAVTVNSSLTLPSDYQISEENKDTLRHWKILSDVLRFDELSESLSGLAIDVYEVSL